MVDALPSRSSTLRVCKRVSLSRHNALVAQRIERSPAKAEVVGSIPAKRAIQKKSCKIILGEKVAKIKCKYTIFIQRA